MEPCKRHKLNKQTGRIFGMYTNVHNHHILLKGLFGYERQSLVPT